MNRLVLSSIIIGTVFLLVSCDDIINSDKNYIKKTFNPSQVLDDQTRSVIMPLHPGNKWYYYATEIKNGKLRNLHIDSIEVLREVIINSEKWYEVWHPFINRVQNILLTNTKSGLWMKCANCDNVLMLEAQYPVADKPYFAGSVYGTALLGYWYNDSLSFLKDTLNRYGVWVESEYQYQGEKYDYTSWYVTKTKGYKRGFKTDTYLVDYGLVKGFQTDNLFYDLAQATLYRNGEIDKLFSKPATIIDFGDVAINTLKSLTVNIFTNTTGKVINIDGDSYYDYPLSQGFLFSKPGFPVTVAPDETFTLDFQFIPLTKGSKEAIFEVITDAGNYYLILKGNGT